MKSFAAKVKCFLVSEDGPTAVEYAVMLALIVIVSLPRRPCSMSKSAFNLRFCASRKRT